VEDFTKKLVNNALRKYLSETKDKIIYYSPCVLVQLFEKFWGFVAIKSNRIMEFRPVVNLTKDVAIELDIQEVKYVNNHRYMFKHTGNHSHIKKISLESF
jgi:hypothetical protein